MAKWLSVFESPDCTASVRYHFGVMSPPNRMDSDITALHEKVRELKIAKDNLQHPVADATGKREQITADVETWLTDAEKVIEEAKELIYDNKERLGNGCFFRLVPKFRTNERKIRKKLAAEKVSVIVALLNEFHRISSSESITGYQQQQGTEVNA